MRSFFESFFYGVRSHGLWQWLAIKITITQSGPLVAEALESELLSRKNTMDLARVWRSGYMNEYELCRYGLDNAGEKDGVEMLCGGKGGSRGFEAECVRMCGASEHGVIGGCKRHYCCSVVGATL